MLVPLLYIVTVFYVGFYGTVNKDSRLNENDLEAEKKMCARALAHPQILQVLKTSSFPQVATAGMGPGPITIRPH